MGGRGSSPFGWAATGLVVVAYANVLLELAGVLLAVVIAVWLLTVAVGRLLSPSRRVRRWVSGRRSAGLSGAQIDEGRRHTDGSN